MKRIILLPIILTPFLSACSIFNSSTSEDNSFRDTSNDISSETTEVGETTSIGSSEDTQESTRYYLGGYGDYVEYMNQDNNPGTIESDYKYLCESVKGEVSGVLQTNYQRGLLEFFNIENKIDIKLNISFETLRQLDDDYYSNNKESYREISLDIYYLDLKFHYEGVGIRQKGNTSRGVILDDGKVMERHYKLSFEETFDDPYTLSPKTWDDYKAKDYRENREFFGLSKIDLRWNRNMDATYTREYFAYQLYRDMGTLSPRSNPIRLEMNIDGKTEKLGVYLAVETITKSFIKRNFVKAERGGDLYKLSWGSGQGAKLNPVDDYFFGVETQLGEYPYFYQQTYTYDLKTNKDDAQHESIKGFINQLNEQHGNTMYEFMQVNSLYDEFIKYTAVSYLLGDPDDLRGNDNNSYVYFTGSTNQMIIIPIDHDRALGSTGYGGNPTGHHGVFSQPFEKRTGYGEENNSNLFNKAIFSTNSSTIRADYLNAVDEVLKSNHFTAEYFGSLYNIVRRHYETDVLLGNGVIGETVYFNFYEDTNIYGEGNLDVSTYIETKASTYKNYIQ